ncbi:MAG: ATP-binding protein [Candidatus Desulfofervidaceae bacterium]|nr:ATP-binding protein [Candidatus Desulfofervidaceae bacterium]
MYIKRVFAKPIKKSLEFFPVVAVVGARQTGKTTLVQNEFPERRYFSLDSPSIREVLQREPYSFLASQKGEITLDEVQKAPEVFDVLKLMVDENRKPGQFLLTGSANFLLLKNISETLAGRIAIFELPGFLVAESMEGKPSSFILNCLKGKVSLPETLDLSISLEDFVLKGTLPPAVLSPDNTIRNLWFDNYIATYLERDLRELSQVASLGDFKRFMSLLALRTAQVLNVSEVARDAGISVSTARNYLHLLELSYQVRRLIPYFANIGKRLVKAPKIHFRDTGLAIALAGISLNEENISLNPYYQFLVETFIVEEIIKLISLQEPRARFYYFRTHGGGEVDLVLELGNILLPIEIKATSKISLKKMASLKQFLSDFKQKSPLGIVVYLGKEIFNVGNIIVVPWQYILVDKN